MEVCRPKVDAFVLHWIQNEPLRKSDFWEDRNGNCRIGSRLAIRLCETSDTWRKLMAPVAENFAQALWASISKPPSTVARQRIATRLTQQHKREVKGSDIPLVKVPKPERVCRGCGKTVRGDSIHCAECDVDIATKRLVEAARAGRIAGRTPGAIAKEAATHRNHAGFFPDNRQWFSGSRYTFGTTEREEEWFLIPKRHQIKHLEFVISWFGTRGSEVQILSPRPILKHLSELTVGAIGRNSGRVKPNPTLCAVIVRNIPSIFTPVRA